MARAYTDIEPLEPEWLWQGRIPQNTTTLIAGDGGIGKGFLLSDLVSRVTRGAEMPDGSEGPPAGSVIMVTSEDDPNMATAWRLRAAGADLTKVYDMTEDFLVPDSVPALRETIESIGDVRMVVIDPLSAVSSIALTSSNVRVRRVVMNPLERLARDLGIAVILVHHTVKSGRVAGTKGITDASRMVLRVSRSAQDERIRLIHVEKSNIAADSAPDIAYTVTGTFPGVHVEYLDVPEAETPTHTPTPAERILALLKSDGATETHEISRKLDIPYGNVRVTLTREKKRGTVYSPERGTWALAPVTAPGELRIVR